MNGLTAINTIWKLTNEQGHTVHTLPNLAALALSHFKQFYKAPPNATLAEVMRTSQLFPRFIEQEDALDLTREVTMGELKATLKWFKGDKSPRLDGWSVELYLAFFQHLGRRFTKSY